MANDLGLVVGKFLPFHCGHSFLIKTALRYCPQVIVLVVAAPDDPIPAALRQSWIQEEHSRVSVRIIPDVPPEVDEMDSEIWAMYTRAILGRSPDMVFTSEDYGEAYAHYLGCRHVQVDLERKHYPISGTQARADIAASWSLLPPATRSFYVKRVVVLGAESTGTSTLARDLGIAYHTCVVPEYGRTYSETVGLGHQWESRDFLKIAIKQVELEGRFARTSRPVMLCDTDVLATSLWHRRYLGTTSKVIDGTAFARRATYSLYLLTGDEIPFVQDGTRDGEHIRHEMQQWFRQRLDEWACPWAEVSGSREERVALAVKAIEQHTGFQPPEG